MSLFSPLLWQGMPFQHPEATLDFLGTHDAWHSVLARLPAARGVAEYRFDDLNHMLDVHQIVHEQLAQALGLSKPSDFSVYDLDVRSGWILFQQIHSLEHQRLRVAAGV
jgi:hypothetical protein